MLASFRTESVRVFLTGEETPPMPSLPMLAECSMRSYSVYWWFPEPSQRVSVVVC
jgi:hypothetical protein